jgi:hypothetical protein
MKDYSIQKKHTAIDTETIDGKVVLLCTPTRALWYPKTFRDIAIFLISTKAHDAHHIWTFNLSYDATAILKFLPLENLEEINDVTFKTFYDDYEIFFIPGKMFSISNNGNKCTLVDAAQFFATTLDNASKIFLNNQKEDTPVIDMFKYQDGKSSEFLFSYLKEHESEIEKYCKKDALLTMQLGEKIDNSCYETYGFRLETYSSNAKIGEKATLNYCGKMAYTNGEGKRSLVTAYPKCIEGSKSVKYAIASYRGGIFETWKRGQFGNVTDFDINSAYPSQMIDLPHWANGSFVAIDDNSYDDIANCRQKEGYKYGWIACEFACSYIPYPADKPETFTHILNGEEREVAATNMKIFYPIGNRQQFITLAEYYFMKKYKFPCKIIGGYVWVKNNDKYKNPFSWIKNIYDTKTEIKRSMGKEAKKNMNYLQCKIGMNGAYGKTVQKNGVNRALYNPFYGSYITAGCRIQVASFILDNHLDSRVLNIATDGILLEGNINYPSNELLGEWEVNYYDEALIIGNGMLQLNDKKGAHSKLRGITNKTDLDIRALLYSMKDKKEYTFTKRRPLHLGEMIAHNKIFKYEDLNKFISFGRKLDLNSDNKRDWPILDSFEQFLNGQFSGNRWTVEEIENKIYER